MSYDILQTQRVAEEAVDETEKKSGDENPAREEGAAAENKDPVAEPEEKELEDKVNFPSLFPMFLDS